MNVEHILLEDITISGTNPRKHIEECDCENPEVSIIKMGKKLNVLNVWKKHPKKSLICSAGCVRNVQALLTINP